MKIIGKSENGFILQAGAGEVANLIGYYWLGEEKCPKLKIGDEIQISKMYQQLDKLARQQGDIKSVIETLKNTIEVLTIVPPVLEHIVSESEV